MMDFGCPAELSLLADGEYAEGLRAQIFKGPWGSLLAYVGLPEQSEAAGLDYGVLDEDGECPTPHGGWTFSSLGDGKVRPAGWHWWGWDYSHYGDYSPGLPSIGGGHLWTLEEVQTEVEELLPDFDEWLRKKVHA